MVLKKHELLEVIKKELYTPVVGDILDQMGLYHQFLPQAVRPLRDDMKLAGYAMTVLMIDVFGQQKKPLQEDEIYVAAGGTMRCAYWGELLTATAKKRGAAGAVVNGWHRDTPQVLDQNWPVFSRGCYAQDSSVRTQVVDYRCRIEIEGVTVMSGDLIFGDVDGVLVIPAEHIEYVIEKALEKARGEKNVRKAIEKGMSATEAFATFGIL